MTCPVLTLQYINIIFGGMHVYVLYRFQLFLLSDGEYKEAFKLIGRLQSAPIFRRLIEKNLGYQ